MMAANAGDAVVSVSWKMNFLGLMLTLSAGESGGLQADVEYWRTRWQNG